MPDNTTAQEQMEQQLGSRWPQWSYSVSILRSFIRRYSSTYSLQKVKQEKNKPFSSCFLSVSRTARKPFRAHKAIFSWSVTKSRKVYTAETSCIKGTSGHFKNMLIRCFEILLPLSGKRTLVQTVKVQEERISILKVVQQDLYSNRGNSNPKMTYSLKEYRMVFASICHYVSSAFIFASTRSDQFCHSSSQLFGNYRWRAASTW